MEAHTSRHLVLRHWHSRVLLHVIHAYSDFLQRSSTEVTYHVDGERARFVHRLALVVWFILIFDLDVHLVAREGCRVAKDSVSAGDKSGQEGLDLLQYIALRHHAKVWFSRGLCEQCFNHLNATLLLHFLKMITRS